jgi:serine/threonine-protein kinase
LDVDRWRQVEEVLDVALNQEPDRWTAVLDDKCSGDPDLRREVEALLGRLGTARGFLESPPSAAAAALLAEVREAAEGASAPLDRRIGAYRLVREVGRGGMSRVYLAERADGQFEQRVALKVLRPGLDSDLDLERFRAERQILASLNHPHIARLLDGGVSDDGLPYLVMEYVEGEPLDRYCAARKLTTRQRLDVFLTVVEATQYAHRNLVVHRDLKPSNILVTNDGVVKLLDFGLAKLLGPAYPAAAAPATRTGHRWMTPEYAAPEQIRGESVTTLTDVYQLGTVLYELLSGRLPFGAGVSSAHELERAVLELDAESLGGEFAGDVDAIVAKAMRKSPEQRYPSAQELGDDIRRFLSGHPVLARRLTAGYLTRRFVRRHRVGLAATAALGLLLATYVGTVMADRARIARALAEATSGTRKAEQTTDFMLGLFDAAEGGKALTDTVTARELLSRGVTEARELSAQPDLQAQMFDVIGRLHMQLGDYGQARPLLEEALAIRRRLYNEFHPDVATALDHLAAVAELEQDLPRTLTLRREALAVRRRVSGDDDDRTADAVYQLAFALHQADQHDEAGRLFDQWLSATARHRPVDLARRADQLVTVASVLDERQQTQRAESLYREALRLQTQAFGSSHHVVAATLVDLGTLLMMAGRLQEGDSLVRQALPIFRSVYPQGHPLLANALRFHGSALLRLGQFTDAVEPLREARAMRVRYLGAGALDVANTDTELAYALVRLGRYEEAEHVANEALGNFRRLFDDRNALVYFSRILVGEALRGEHRFAEAETLLLAAYARFEHPNTITKRWRGDALAALVRLYEAEGKPVEAERYRAIMAQPVPMAGPSAKPSSPPPTK